MVIFMSWTVLLMLYMNSDLQSKKASKLKVFPVVYSIYNFSDADSFVWLPDRLRWTFCF